MDINVYGAVRCVKMFAPQMIDSGGGQIMLVASIAGLLGVGPHASAYAASKHALVGYGDAVREFLFPHGINVSIICPGPVPTNIATNIRTIDSPDSYAGGDPRESITPEVIAKRVIREGIEKRMPYVITHPEDRARLEKRANLLDQACQQHH